MLWMVYQRNGNGYQITINTFFENAKALLPRFGILKVSAQAFCKARTKIPYEVIENLCSETCKLKPGRGFKGYQVLAIDGAGFLTPNSNELHQHFTGRNHTKTTQCLSYFPQGLLVAAVNVHTKMLAHVMVDSLHGSEVRMTQELIKNVSEKSIFLLDRGLATANILSSIYNSGQHFVARIKTRSGSLKEFVDFGHSRKREEYVTLRNGITVRLCKIKLPHYKERILIATSLPESIASLRDLARLYESRWEIETVFRYIKDLQDLEAFHSRTFNGVMQEIFCHFLIHNLAALMCEEEETSKGLVNRKAAITYFGQQVIPLFISTIKATARNAILNGIWEKIEHSREKRRPGRRFPRICKKPLNRWSAGKYRSEELRRFSMIS